MRLPGHFSWKIILAGLSSRHSSIYCAYAYALLPRLPRPARPPWAPASSACASKASCTWINSSAPWLPPGLLCPSRRRRQQPRSHLYRAPHLLRLPLSSAQSRTAPAARSSAKSRRSLPCTPGSRWTQAPAAYCQARSAAALGYSAAPALRRRRAAPSKPPSSGTACGSK